MTMKKLPKIKIISKKVVKIKRPLSLRIFDEAEFILECGHSRTGSYIAFKQENLPVKVACPDCSTEENAKLGIFNDRKGNVVYLKRKK